MNLGESGVSRHTGVQLDMADQAPEFQRRGKLLFKLGDLILEILEEFAMLESLTTASLIG